MSGFLALLASGLVATLAMSALLAAGYGLGLTRFSFPWLLGSLVTPDRDRARPVGMVIHVANGWALSFVYFAIFAWWGEAGALRGAFVGLCHAAVMLLLVTPLLPGLHPRMAGESADATTVRGLEPPGFLGLHYGSHTPIAIVLSHLAYGAILGALY